MAKSEKWEPCPRCGSNRVESRGGCFFFLAGLALTGISIWLLIIPPIGILGIVIGIALMIASPFAKNMLQCQDCKKSWKYPATNNPYKKIENEID